MGLTRLAARRLTSDRDPRSLSMRLRSRRMQPLLAMIEEVHGRYGHVTIIDVGGNRQYWSLLPTEMFEQKRISVAVVNPDKSQLGEEEPHFSFVQGDGCDLSMFNASAFHIAHSNSVLEHVGGWNRMRRFAGEISRVAERYLVQTPHYWFPLEPHCFFPFFHWLPRSWRVALVIKFQLGHWPRQKTKEAAMCLVESARLLDKKKFAALFPQAEIRTERLILIPKSLLAIKAR
jgi:hypothetical protein